jgi:pyruvate/2-oxoacid:ferredoxin oxidoreductase beta subunit
MHETPITQDSLPQNPVESFLRTDRMPHIWCPGCGIGTTVNCFARALETSGLDLQKVSVYCEVVMQKRLSIE